MSLDITILDKAGGPKEGIPLTVDEHWAFASEAQRMHLELWSRMSDYYEDADYEVEEVGRLSQETEKLQKVFSTGNLAEKLRRISELLQVAANERSAVSAIAD